MGRTIDIRKEGQDVDKILFGEDDDECLVKGGDDDTFFIDDAMNDKNVEIAYSDIDNLIKALQTAKKEWT